MPSNIYQYEKLKLKSNKKRYFFQREIEIEGIIVATKRYVILREKGQKYPSTLFNWLNIPLPLK